METRGSAKVSYNTVIVLLTRLVLATLLCGAAWGQAPSYSAASILNVSDWSHGPFAPNSVLALFGTNLVLPGNGEMTGNGLSNRMNGVQVLVDSVPAYLFYVSETQINFIVPANELIDGSPIPVKVVRQSVEGPVINITLVDSAPALFKTDAGYAIAQHADFSQVTTDAPAHPGEGIAIYATGLGKTDPNPKPGEVPTIGLILEWKDRTKVYLNGALLDSRGIIYAGTTPGWPGLYQINLWLPENTGPDPEIRVAIGAQSSSAGLKLAVQ